MERDHKESDRIENGVYSVKLKAGRRRTYFFDVRTTRANDYYVTITESKKRNDEGYDRHKVFLYKEDFNQFLKALNETIDHVKNELLPDYDFDEFHRERETRRKEWDAQNASSSTAPTPMEGESIANSTDESVDTAEVKETPSEINKDTSEAKTDASEEDLKWE